MTTNIRIKTYTVTFTDYDELRCFGESKKAVRQNLKAYCLHSGKRIKEIELRADYFMR